MAWDIGSILTSKDSSTKGSSATGSGPRGSISNPSFNQQSKQQFNTLRNRLLLSYLLITAVVLGAFSVAVYVLVARDRNQQLNDSLQQVANTSVGSFEIIQHEYLELVTGDDDDDYEEDGYDERGNPENDYNESHKDNDYEGDEGEGDIANEDGQQYQGVNFEPISLSEFMDRYNNRSINPSITPSINPLTTQAPNQSPTVQPSSNGHPVPVTSPLSVNDQGVEWFNSQQQLMVWEETRLSQPSLPEAIAFNGVFTQENHVRSFIQPIYQRPIDRPTERPTDKPSSPQDITPPTQPMGYVRSSQSTLQLEQDLRRLREILGIGVVIVSGVVTVGGLWLTRESLRPVLTSFEQLKQFTSDASHELRNPLTAIRASVAVMQSHPERIHPDDTDKIKAIASASTQMSQLVDDLLLLARMDRAAPNQKAWRRIALDEVLEDLVNLYGDRARQAHITLQAQLDLSLDVNGDAAQLQRLFTNLLANALQYTPAGGTVTVSLHHAGAEALVQVQDTGIGIAPEQLPHLFDRFWRADQARNHHSGGTGLGLAIALAIAQRHGGTITVQSQPGKGSCFQVKLPLV